MEVLTVTLISILVLSTTVLASSSASSSTSAVRKGRTGGGSTPNEIEQWPDFLVDLPAFGRQVILEPPRNASVKPSSAPSTSPPTSEKPSNKSTQLPRKANRRADPDINDIISGLVKLLGGQANVQVAEPERRKHTDGGEGDGGDGGHPSSSRINNRGPPSLSDLPPAIPPGLISNSEELAGKKPPPSPQLRPPPRPLGNGNNNNNFFNPNNNRVRPVIRPPPQRPPQQTSGKVRFPSDEDGSLVPPPFTSGVPVPEQLVPLQRPPGNLIPLQRPSTTSTTSTTTTTTTPQPPPVTTPQEVELEPSEQDVTTSVGDGSDVPEQKFSVDSPSSASTAASSTQTIAPTPPLSTLPASSNTRWTVVKDESTKAEDVALRPGVVFDETGANRDDVIRNEPSPVDVITAAGTVYPSAPGDVFDVTVSANQGFGAKRPGLANEESVDDDIISSPISKGGQRHDFVSIDGRKTYINLLPTEVVDPSGTRRENDVQTIGPAPPAPVPQKPPPPPPPARQPPIDQPELAPGIGIGTGFIRPLPPEEASDILANNNNNNPSGNRRRPPSGQPPVPSVGASRPAGVGGGDHHNEDGETSTRRPFTRRPAAPPVRIDTCIVGDDTTCKSEDNESCRTVFGVSSCYCRPGYARRRHREPCKTVSSLLISLKVDRMDSKKVSWHHALNDPDSEEYQRLEYESEHALESILKRTPYRAFFVRSDVNNFYPLGSRVMVNATVRLESNPMTTTTKIRHELRKHITAAIRQSPTTTTVNGGTQPGGGQSQESNRLGDSLLAVDGFLNAIPQLGDFNECLDPKTNDCDEHAECENNFGSFTCRCKPGYVDRDPNNRARVGRKCQTCSPAFCNNRGDCVVKNGAQVCQCRGSYFGERCEMDGEVVGVAVGASVAAVIIIVLTLVFLCLWSRKWKREQAKSDYAHTFTFVNPGLSGLAVLSQRLGMNVGGVGGGKGHPPPYRLNPMDADRMHPGYHPDPGSTLLPALAQNVYAQPEPLMPKRSHTPTSLYATANVAMPTNAMYHQQQQQQHQHHQLQHQPQQHQMSQKFLSSLKKDGGGSGMNFSRSTPLSFGESSEDDLDDNDVLTARIGGGSNGTAGGGGGGGGAYNVPMVGSGLRPKSRTSAYATKSQNGIYYDMDYNQGDLYSRGGTLSQPAIPMATYTQNIRPFYS